MVKQKQTKKTTAAVIIPETPVKKPVFGDAKKPKAPMIPSTQRERNEQDREETPSEPEKKKTVSLEENQKGDEKSEPPKKKKKTNTDAPQKLATEKDANFVPKKKKKVQSTDTSEKVGQEQDGKKLPKPGPLERLELVGMAENVGKSEEEPPKKTKEKSKTDTPQKVVPTVPKLTIPEKKSEKGKDPTQKKKGKKETSLKKETADKDKEKIKKPVFGGPKIKKAAPLKDEQSEKVDDKDNGVKDVNTVTKRDSEPVKEGDMDKNTTEQSGCPTEAEQSQVPANVECIETKVPEKIKPKLPKAKKGFMAPVVKKPDTAKTEEKRANKEAKKPEKKPKEDTEEKKPDSKQAEEKEKTEKDTTQIEEENHPKKKPNSKTTDEEKHTKYETVTKDSDDNFMSDIKMNKPDQDKGRTDDEAEITSSPNETDMDIDARGKNLMENAEDVVKKTESATVDVPATAQGAEDSDFDFEE